MKKTLFAASLLAASLSVSAAGLTAFATYDYDKTESASHAAEHTAKLGLKAATAFGLFDASFAGSQRVAASHDNNNGGEFGYSLGTKLFGVGVTGRAAYGQLNHLKYYSLGAEAALPLTSTVGLFAGYRHTNGLNATTASAANRYTVGVDVALMKDLTARVGYARTSVGGDYLNGVTTAVSYSF